MEGPCKKFSSGWACFYKWYQNERWAITKLFILLSNSTGEHLPTLDYKLPKIQSAAYNACTLISFAPK